MSIISYAQNFEDVMLWRALKGIERGFYIDVGAQDPLVDSTSLAFYEQGWRGVHVEPTLQYSKKLRDARPDEIVEQVAVGNYQGNLIFYEFADTGLSTADPEIARRHQENGFFAIRSEVTVVSLDFIFDKYSEKDIHWLKIDVEGLEKSVLESWSDSVVRPWVIVIESTKPLTQDESYFGWEHLVLNKGYCFAYFDGLNRFYVHEDHRELLSSFAVPPNIFDGFMLSGTASQPFCRRITGERQQAESRMLQAEEMAQAAELKAQKADARVQQAEAKWQELESSVQQAKEKAREVESRGQQTEAWALQAEVRAQQAEMKTLKAEADLKESIAQLQAVYASNSWRITSPLRAIRKYFSYYHRK